MPTVNGKIEADDIKAARAKIKALNLLPVKIYEETIANKKILLMSKNKRQWDNI